MGRVEDSLGALGDRARLLKGAFDRHGVEYMIIGKAAAMAQGMNVSTRDIDIYPSRNLENRRRLLAALQDIGFEMRREVAGRVVSTDSEITEGRDFVQFLSPFDLDVVFAPDGFESFEEATKYRCDIDGYPFLSIDGIIISKRAAGRQRDRQDLPLLEQFRDWKRRHGQN